jgi:hypothetical protein
VSDPGLRNRAVAAVSRSWAQASPAQAAQWISSITDIPGRDAATAAYSSTLSRTDPAQAAQWAAQITNATDRNRSLTEAVRRWRAVDAVAAAAFVQTATFIPADLKARLLR